MLYIYVCVHIRVCVCVSSCMHLPTTHMDKMFLAEKLLTFTLLGSVSDSARINIFYTTPEQKINALDIYIQCMRALHTIQEREKRI